ncbi:hypothetical protein MN608_09449 [Microdochium nivale]|nr:hypothetical protein MN608_09449 [Microdochium nivale]
MLSDDGTVNDQTTMGNLWNMFTTSASKELGRSFLVKTEGLQRGGLEQARFRNIEEVTYKVRIEVILAEQWPTLEPSRFP